MKSSKYISVAILVVTLILVSACGGGGSKSPPPPPPPGVGGFNAGTLSVAPALDGSDDIYVGGDFTAYNDFEANHIARFNSDGSFDLSFVTGTGFDNSLPIPTVCCPRVKTIAPANDGSGDVYVGGTFTSYNGTVVGRIARLNVDGSLDTGFATGTGFDYITGTGFAGGVRVIVPANDGSGDIYVGGSYTSYNGTTVSSGIIRLNNDGSLDTGFNTSSGWGEDSIALTNDGSGDVYVAKRSGPGIARLNSDGSIDAGFVTGLSGFNDEVRAVAEATDGSNDVYVGGFFSDYNGTVTNRIARLNSDGSLDAGFVTGSGFLGTVKQIIPAIDGSGDIYVGGNPQAYQDNFIGRFVRLNDDGTIDMNFIHKFFPFPGFNDETRSIALAIDGSGDVYVGGGFTSYNVDLSVDHLVSFTVDGSLKLGRLD